MLLGFFYPLAFSTQRMQMSRTRWWNPRRRMLVTRRREQHAGHLVILVIITRHRQPLFVPWLLLMRQAAGGCCYQWWIVPKEKQRDLLEACGQLTVTLATLETENGVGDSRAVRLHGLNVTPERIPLALVDAQYGLETHFRQVCVPEPLMDSLHFIPVLCLSISKRNNSLRAKQLATI